MMADDARLPTCLNHHTEYMPIIRITQAIFDNREGYISRLPRFIKSDRGRHVCHFVRNRKLRLRQR